MGEPEKGRVTTPSVPVFSKAPLLGQWFVQLSVLVLWAVASSGCSPSARTGQGGARTPSGEPVPRYVTLKAAPVNARGGPGEDYKALWQYTAKGLPMQVVEETTDWRRVCDPEGGLGWVRTSALDPRHTVMRIAASDLTLRSRPAADARPVAALASRAVADLVECKGGWCRISVDHASGWVRANELWGVAEAPQCRPVR
jgi:SH3-like domain-containing protein